MRLASIALVLATIAIACDLGAQEGGPTIAAARVAVAQPSMVTTHALVPPAVDAPCGSAWKNALLLGLGLSAMTGMIELTYTIVREPFVRNGHDLPRADPRLIAWAGGAGFLVGLIGTELCRSRRR